MRPEKEHLKKKKNVLDDSGSKLSAEQNSTQYSTLDSATKCEKVPASQRIVKKQTVKDIRKVIASFINLTNAIPFKFFHNKFRCFYCTQEFDLCEDLKEHTRKNHPICEATFRAMKLRGRSTGVKIKIDTSSMSCKMCLQELSDFNSAVEHLEVKHNTNVKNLGLLQPLKLIHDQFSCPFCQLNFRSFSTLLKHLNSSHTDNRYICSDCGKACPTYSNLKTHNARYHSIATNKCLKCNLAFLTNHELKTHMGTTHGSKVVKCHKCTEKFETQYQKMRHMVEAHNGGHKCPYCALVFIKYSFMSNHVRKSHLKEKNVQCSVCNLKFFDEVRLKVHMVKHVGGREFGCDYCGKTFIRRKNLVTHMALHRKNDVGLG